ncbi:transcriptional regulator [Longispora fulva]|uniref:DNA-binding XRE family transcriptional regulator n=1 Tax=Longispora fulva TaxID=619741 RepID=A0A8J7KKR5_9ACTN|nr:XRE family transcriptional regulator [Longispora fulva]MBG6138439.1 DNA-binding XRE family transcriptional regulator [Longispora fulva]GIG63287.1 transcriptional regulator [Longispora fulva]
MRNWKDVRADALALGAGDPTALVEKRRVLEERIRAFKLTELRKRADMTQVEVAEVMGVKQPWISKIESGDLDHVELETLRSYIAALGGRLKVVADFGDEQHVIAA